MFIFEQIRVGGSRNFGYLLGDRAALKAVLIDPSFRPTIWPGHDFGCRPSSTIGLEKRTNPFLLCEDFESFLELKADWLRYKRRFGLT